MGDSEDDYDDEDDEDEEDEEEEDARDVARTFTTNSLQFFQNLTLFISSPF